MPGTDADDRGEALTPCGRAVRRGSIRGKHLLAIEMGGTKLQLCAGTATGEIVDRHRLEVNRAAGGAGIRTQIAETMPRLLERWQPHAIGVGYGGPVDWRTGRIQRSHQIGRAHV